MLLLVPLALSAPRFTGPPETVRLAGAAWAAAEACTGRSPDVPEVAITHDLPPTAVGGGIAGLARYPAGKAGTIRLVEEARPVTVAHEVAHAWVNAGPRALVEGRTQVLTQCIQEQRPDLFEGLLDRASDLALLPDLRAWNRPALDESAVEETLDAYLGSFRYFRAVAAMVPRERLWAPELTTWEAFEALLVDAGDRAKPALDALRGGADAQRRVLVDADLDGMPALQEAAAGTDPARYDTDGDGWWDGAPTKRPTGALPLPHSAHPVCLPWVPPGAEELVVRAGGALGGKEIPEVLLAATPPGGLVTWETGWNSFPGGVWIVADGERLVPNERCAMRPGITVRAAGPITQGTLAAMAEGAEEAMEAYAERGVARREVVVTVSDRSRAMAWVGHELYVPVAGVDADPASVGRQAAAFAHTRELPGEGYAGPFAGALVRAAYGQRHTTAQLGVPGYAIAEWTRAAARCPDGWAGVLDGRCENPAGPSRQQFRKR